MGIRVLHRNTDLGIRVLPRNTALGIRVLQRNTESGVHVLRRTTEPFSNSASGCREPAGSQERTETGATLIAASSQTEPSASLKRIREVLEQTRTRITHSKFSKRAEVGPQQQGHIDGPSGKKRGRTNSVPSTAKKMCGDSGLSQQSVRMRQYIEQGMIPITAHVLNSVQPGVGVGSSSSGVGGAGVTQPLPMNMGDGSSGNLAHLVRNFPPRLSRGPY